MKTLRTAYFDCYSGVSGDMILGALIDLGVDIKKIRKALNSLNLKGYKLQAKKVQRGGLTGTNITVAIEKSSHSHRKYSDIRKLIEQADLPASVQKNSIEIFKRIAKVEAQIHNTTVEKIHFHEVGAVDSIVDIVGGVWAMESLKFDKVYASPINVGEGYVDCAHGRLPVPAPATLKLLKDIPVFSSGVQKELATPTGVAIVGFYSEKFQSMPRMTVKSEGYGAGDHIIPSTPNFLRVILGEMESKNTDSLFLIETNVDDMNPEIFDEVMNSLFEAGALDVYFSPIIMKKNRPATKVSVISPSSGSDALAKILLTETSSFGVRYHSVDRVTLDREVQSLKTSYGIIKIKLGRLDGETVQATPEFEDCRKAARKKKIPVKKVYDDARALAHKKWLA